MLRFQFRNAVVTPATVISIIGLYLFMSISTYPRLSADLMYNYQNAISLGYGAVFIPVAAVVPICFYLHHIGARQSEQLLLIRGSLFSYARSSILTAAVSGMIVTLGTFLLFSITCYLYSPTGVPYIGLGMYSLRSDGGTIYAKLFEHPAALYTLMGAIYSLSGAMWPVIYLLCFSFTKNQYIVVSIPFIVKTALAYIGQLLNLYFLDPGQLQLTNSVSTRWFGGGIPSALGYTCIAILLCGGIWTVRKYREVRYA